MRRLLSRLVSVALAAGLFLAGCGEESASSATSEVTVFAATSLTAAFTELADGFEAAHDGTRVTLNFGASSALLQQLREGATADVFASADAATMDKAVAAQLVRQPVTFARNRLVIVTKPGNPAGIRHLGDLAGTGVVALCGAEVPCGAYAAHALAKAGVAVDESRVTRGQNVAATLAAVSEGDAVAGVVYATDARSARARVATVAIPDAHNVVAAYPIAQVRDAAHGGTAHAFIAYVRSSSGQRVLRGFGFLKA